MADEDEDNLGDLLAQTSQAPGRSATPAPPKKSSATAENGAAEASETPEISGISALQAARPSAAMQQATRAKSRKPQFIFTAALFLVGLALMGWAVYGAMILRGAVESEKEDAHFMGKLMLFGAGPLGVILFFAGFVSLVKWLSARKS